MGIAMVAGAIVSEVIATLSLRASHGLSRPWPTLVVVIGYAAAFVLLAQALKSLDVGPVYAVWSGLGTVGALVGGVLLFGEQLHTATVVGAGLIVFGVAVMYLGGGLAH
ncbi:DMT family transporter [Streptomyces sp. NPDC057682]|uniref:DMT family transporter n=1 Tax=Streptomyces sp. NPDC057682 TaxID=3346210 RepID=UPI00367FCE11